VRPDESTLSVRTLKSVDGRAAPGWALVRAVNAWCGVMLPRAECVWWFGVDLALRTGLVG